MQRVILISAIYSLMFIIDESYILKRKNSPWCYVRFFLFLIFVNLCIYSTGLYGNENEMVRRTLLINEKSHNIFKDEENILDLNCRVFEEDECKKYKNKMIHHRREGQKCFREAHEMCILIPDLDDFEKADELFIMTGIIALGQGKFSAAVSALTAALIEYGLETIKQWRKMKSLLYESEYHFEMAEHYESVVCEGECHIYRL